MDAEYRVLDLFCGLGGFSAAFEESDRWEVVTVDLAERFDPDVCTDVFDLRPSDFDREFDVVLASPPCQEFSPANNLNGDRDPSPDAVALVYHAIGLIRGLSPDYWVLENPYGRLRTVIGHPDATVTYCQYGREQMKPTDLWGCHPPMTYRRCQRGDGCHDGNREGTNNYPEDAAEKSLVPYGLSDAIREACERALDGDAREQATVADF
jgi:hypothetical protein